MSSSLLQQQHQRQRFYEEKRSSSSDEEEEEDLLSSNGEFKVADPVEEVIHPTKRMQDSRRNSDDTFATVEEADCSYSSNMDGPLKLTVAMHPAENNNNNNNNLVGVVEEEEEDQESKGEQQQQPTIEPLNSYARLDQEAMKRKERRMSSQLKERAAAFEGKKDNNNSSITNSPKSNNNNNNNNSPPPQQQESNPKPVVAPVVQKPTEVEETTPKEEEEEESKPTMKRRKKKRGGKKKPSTEETTGDDEDSKPSGARRRRRGDRPMLRKSNSTGTIDSVISEGDLLASQHDKIMSGRKLAKPRRFRRGTPSNPGPDVVSWSHENSSQKRLQQDKELFKNRFGGGGVKAKMAQLEAVNEKVAEETEKFNKPHKADGRPRMRRVNSHGSLDTVESSEELELAALPPFHGFGVRGGRRSSIVREATLHGSEDEYDEITVDDELEEEYDEVTVDDEEEYEEVTVEDGYAQLAMMDDSLVAYEREAMSKHQEEASRQAMDKYSSHSVDTESCVSFYNEDPPANPAPAAAKKNVMDTTNTKNAKKFVELVAQMYSVPEDTAHTADTDSYDTFFNDEASANVGGAGGDGRKQPKQTRAKTSKVPKQRKQKNRLEQFKPAASSPSTAVTTKVPVQTGHNSVDTESCETFYNDEPSVPVSQETTLDASSRHSVDTESCATFYDDDGPSVSPKMKKKIVKAADLQASVDDSQTSLREEELTIGREANMGDSLFMYNSSDPGMSLENAEETVADSASRDNASDPATSVGTTGEEEVAKSEIVKSHDSRHARRSSVSDLKNRFETGAGSNNSRRRVQSDVGKVKDFQALYNVRSQNDGEDSDKDNSPISARSARRSRPHSDVSNVRSFKYEGNQSGSDDGNNTEDEYVPGGGYRGTFMDFDAQQRAIARRRKRKEKGESKKPKAEDTSESTDVVESSSREKPEEKTSPQEAAEDESPQVARTKSGGLEPAEAAQGVRNGRRIRSDLSSVKDFQAYHNIRSNTGAPESDLYGGQGFRGCLLDFDAQQQAIARSRQQRGDAAGRSSLKDRMAMFEKK
mmetsp:Transcript_25867/g.71197  ORF Transcript_25867/g.71197 Transcript_25867/m.71197 type:complete len:1043 (+) Transcript_25867:95-3223(+)